MIRIYDHTVGSTFSRQVQTPAPDIDEIHIDPMIDGAGFAVCGEHLRVNVFPPDTDPDRPGAFISICEDNLSAEQARLVATLLLAAAEYVEYLEAKSGHHALLIRERNSCPGRSIQSHNPENHPALRGDYASVGARPR